MKKGIDRTIQYLYPGESYHYRETQFDCIEIIGFLYRQIICIRNDGKVIGFFTNIKLKKYERTSPNPPTIRA